jgi:phenylpyruvate tautomerase PptA (4-oxalocrotonate tautomerase family)
MPEIIFGGEGEHMSDEKQEPQLMAALTELVKQFSDYDPPRLRKDGDIVIPLDAVLKKNREAHQNFADAFSEMMSEDLGPKRSSTWVK